MKCGRLLPLSALCLSACFATTAHAVVVNYYLWTGVGNGWKNQALPPNDGSAALAFGNSVREIVPFSGDFTANSLHFLEENQFRFVSATPGTPLTLTLNNGVDASADDFTRFDFSPDLTVNIAQNQTWNLGNSGAATIHGTLTGAGDLTIGGSGSAALVLANSSGVASTYSGTLRLTPSTAPFNFLPTLAVWGSQSIGNGTIVFGNGGLLSTHLAPTLANDFVFSDGPLFAGQTSHAPVRFRMWDAPGTTLTGSITLANNTIFGAINAFENKLASQLANNTGALPQPGPISRNPLIIAGAIGDGGLGRSLTIDGSLGILMITGANNTYSGGTIVNGTAIFGSNASIPAAGTLQVGNPNVGQNPAYAGMADVTSEAFATFLSKVSSDSTGSVGVDTLPGVGSSRVDLQACKLEYSIVSPK